MASVELNAARPRDWALANPWLWMGWGVLSCGLAWVVALLTPTGLMGLRWLFITLGLFSAGIGVTLRLNSDRPPYLGGLSKPIQVLLLQGMACLFALLALGILTAFVLSIAGAAFIPWRPGQLFLISVICVPVLAWTAWITILPSRGNWSISVAQESAAVLVLSALSLFACSWALYLGPDKGDAWLTMRIFFAIFALVAMVAAPLVAAPQALRRFVLSLLFVLHFGGIITAALSVPPMPWLVEQIWVRLYRPYLEFMYINNAYHFYAPEPGPASYMWFRVMYEDPQGKLHGAWVKVPDLDDKGWHQHTTALEYQRYLALITNTLPYEPNIQFFLPEGGNQIPAPFYKKRLDHSPGNQVIGAPTPPMVIPFHPVSNLPQQYRMPTANVRKMMETYTRAACRRPHPEHPDWKVVGAKVYHVTHQVPPWRDFAAGADARDPVYYLSYFMGDYNPQGQLLPQQDAFIYWLLPTYRTSGQQNADIEDWSRRHAGDPKWISVHTPRGRQWVEPPMEGTPAKEPGK